MQENVQGFASQPWKGMTFNTVQCLLLGYLCQSVNPLDVAIKCHEQIDSSIESVISMFKQRLDSDRRV